ncbi:MAG TPA: tetratricopeptide repeat protein [Nitrospiria bacterium]|nr:tetratricopeptide repeat protein [Nitrospiria bacterium]
MSDLKRLPAFAGIGPWLVLTALLYAPFLGDPFQYDDEHGIVLNAAIQQPDAWKAALTGTLRSSAEIRSGHYRPLTYLTYWLTLRLSGLSPGAFHAVNLGLHVIVAWLIVILARELTHDQRQAVLAGALFALHPAVSEAVLYASARATLLSSLFMLASLVCFVRARRPSVPTAYEKIPPGPPFIKGGWGDLWRSTAKWWLGWAGFGLAALLSKESAVALPLLCLAADHCVLGSHHAASRRSRWWPHVVSFSGLIVFVAWLGLWRYVVQGLTSSDAFWRYAGIVGNQVAAIGLAIRLFLVPWPLTVEHPLPAWPELAAVGLIALAGLCAAGGLIGLASPRPAARRAGFFALWAVIVALPTALWPLNVPFQEHRAYLQHAGLAMLAAPGLVAAWDAGRVKRTATAATVIVIAAAWGWLIVDQGRAWSDPVRLWERARQHAPASFRAHTNAGLALAGADRWDDASRALDAALAINADYPPALVARGALAQRAGQSAAARADYERAVALRPDYVPALFNLGLLSQASNDPASAEQWYRRALAVNPLHVDSLLNLGVLLLTRERFEEADALFASARSVRPDSPEALYYSGVIADRAGRIRDAEAFYHRAGREAALAGKRELAAEADARARRLADDRATSRAPERGTP